MEKENNIVYVKTKNGIYKCYKSEQMHKPIYYPVESKTNSFIDYNEVISILSIDDLYNELKKQKEIINRLKELNLMINDSNYIYSQDEITSKNLELLQMLEDKEM